MEIERKFLVQRLPDCLEQYDYHIIEQAYLCTDPVVRVRKSDNDYYLTYKGRGLIAREETNLLLTKDGYYHLLSKADGNIITKKRVLIPYNYNNKSYTIELDIFSGVFTGLVIAEVEFESMEDAQSFIAPGWFGKDVSDSCTYHNSTLSRMEPPFHF